MSARRAAVVLPLSTLAILVGLFAIRPFALANNLLDKAFDAAPDWTQVRLLYRDPAVQEISTGEHPLTGLRALAQSWQKVQDPRRVFFMGNSQMQAVSLGPGEGPASEPEKTYFHLVADECAQRDPRTLLYRLSAPGISYIEALWYVHYLLSQPHLRPSAIVLQMNYQGLRQFGIRDGMLELLAEPSFRESISRAASSSVPYASAFANALSQYDTQAAKLASAASEKTPGKASTTGVIESFGFGNNIETKVRDGVARIPGFERKTAFKEHFLDVLYRIRLYIFRLDPGKARSIGGARLAQSRAAVEAIAGLCRDHHIELYLFNAPMNPKVVLYATASDRRVYRELLDDIRNRYGARVYDFENAVPAASWGRWMNGPDPMHLSRAGHRQLAKLFLNAGICGSAAP
jgi:hypothetical protein